MSFSLRAQLLRIAIIAVFLGPILCGLAQNGWQYIIVFATIFWLSMHLGAQDKSDVKPQVIVMVFKLLIQIVLAGILYLTGFALSVMLPPIHLPFWVSVLLTLSGSYSLFIMAKPYVKVDASALSKR